MGDGVGLGRSSKYSLANRRLYPEAAFVDPALTLAAPRGLTLQTGLDALSHSLESLWNVNANPVSANYAVEAARDIIDALPRLLERLDDLDLRTRLARASLFAGLHSRNTKTALAHNISYGITLRHGTPHGIACSFCLPQVMGWAIGASPACDESLKRTSGEDLHKGVQRADEVHAKRRRGVPSRPITVSAATNGTIWSSGRWKASGGETSSVA